MLDFIDEILKNFQSCFSRKAAFHWFVIITMGLMLRSGQLGVTSVIRYLPLRPACYETMLHFFRASSWSAADLKQRWLEIVLCHAPLYKVSGLTILIGDGVKQAKEGRYMPGVKKLFQKSENSSKPEYIFGHMFGGRGGPALKRLNELNSSGSVRMDLVTKAKKSCTAYELPPARRPGKGRPAIKGSSVKLKELFTTEILYGKCEAIRYYHVDLLWGQKLYQPLRFVLVESVKAREKILAAVRAVEAHMALSCVVMGVLQTIHRALRGRYTVFNDITPDERENKPFQNQVYENSNQGNRK